MVQLIKPIVRVLEEDNKISIIIELNLNLSVNSSTNTNINNEINSKIDNYNNKDEEIELIIPEFNSKEKINFGKNQL